jgi:hypothetical protein
MKKIILAFSILLISTIGIILFIKLSNDHKECNQKIEKKLDSNGNTVTTKIHICNEKYNF